MVQSDVFGGKLVPLFCIWHALVIFWPAMGGRVHVERRRGRRWEILAKQGTRGVFFCRGQAYCSCSLARKIGRKMSSLRYQTLDYTRGLLSDLHEGIHHSSPTSPSPYCLMSSALPHQHRVTSTKGGTGHGCGIVSTRFPISSDAHGR